MKQDQGGFIDMGPLSRASRLILEAQVAKMGVGGAVKSLNGWLKDLSKDGQQTEKELEMPDIPQLCVDEGFLKLI